MATPRQPTPCLKRALRLLAFGLLSLVVVVGGWVLYERYRSQNHNALAVGHPDDAVPFEIPIADPIELDGLSRDEIYDLRRAAVQTYPALVDGDYTPAYSVFHQIDSGRPWWGMQGQFYHGPGPQSIVGPAEESRYIINPFLLVGAEFLGLSFYDGGRLRWDAPRVDAALDDGTPMTWMCAADHLYWDARNATATATYDMTACLRAMNRFTAAPMGIDDLSFDLIAYNARDFNLDYIWVRYDDSTNVFKENTPTEPFKISHYLHRGGSCGYASGCNNMSPPTPEIMYLELTALPATLVVWLWDDAPSSPQQPPDFTVVLHFD